MKQFSTLLLLLFSLFTFKSVDAQIAKIYFSITQDTTSENSSTYTVIVNSDTTGSQEMEIKMKSSASTVTEGDDIPFNTRTATFTSSKTYTTNITIYDDSDCEGPETLTLALRNPTNATIGDDSLFTLIINDNDKTRGYALSENFELDTIGFAWNDTADWKIETFGGSSINGNSLRHDASGINESYISTDLRHLNISNNTTIWRFNIKKLSGVTITGNNRFWVYLTANESNLNSNTIDGYAIGFNFRGNSSGDDSLVLWKITNGTFDKSILKTNFLSSGNGTMTLGVEVRRTAGGTWYVNYDANGGFDNLISAGSASNNDYTFNDYFGLYYKYNNTGERKLLWDDISIFQDTCGVRYVWSGSGSTKNWLEAKNWLPQFIPDDENAVAVLNDSILTSSYDVDLPAAESINLKKLVVAPEDTTHPILLTDYFGISLYESDVALSLGPKATYIDTSSNGFPNFVNSGKIFIDSAAEFKILKHNSFSISSLVSRIDASSNACGLLHFATAGRIISASGKTYPTSLQLSSLNSDPFTSSGSNTFSLKGDFIVDRGTSYESGMSGDFEVGSDIINNGNISFTNSQATIFNGSVPQMVKGNAISFPSIEINNFNNVSFMAPVTINNQLDLTNGKIQLDQQNVILDSSITINQSSGYIVTTDNAKVSITLSSNTNALFPVGFNPYLPVNITCGSCTGASPVEFLVGVQQNVYKDPENEINQVTSNVVEATWDISPQASANNVDVQLTWPASAESSLTRSTAAFGFWQDGVNYSWTNKQANISGSDPYTAVTANALTLSPDTYYFGIGGSSSPVPIELIYFNVKPEGNQAVLEWATATELNNSHFEVQRSLDGKSWKNIKNVRDKGNSFITTTYKTKDEAPAPTLNYYRLKQVDLDGSYKYSETKALDFRGILTSQKVYFSGDKLVLKLNGDEVSPMEISVTTIDGRNLYTEQITTSGSNNISLKHLPHLKQGIYLLQIKKNNEVTTYKILK